MSQEINLELGEVEIITEKFEIYVTKEPDSLDFVVDHFDKRIKNMDKGHLANKSFQEENSLSEYLAKLGIITEHISTIINHLK